MENSLRSRQVLVQEVSGVLDRVINGYLCSISMHQHQEV